MQDNNSILSDRARQILGDSKSKLFISIVSFWEISIKSIIGKLELDYTIEDVHNVCLSTDIIILPIQISIVKQLQLLPLIHKDRFDRIIGATAIDLNLQVITRDNYIGQYNLRTIW